MYESNLPPKHQVLILFSPYLKHHNKNPIQDTYVSVHIDDYQTLIQLFVLHISGPSSSQF